MQLKKHMESSKILYVTNKKIGNYKEMEMNENQYIMYRRIKAFGSRILFTLFRIFPIKKNLISICTFEGKGGFGCNPKYIVEELHRRNSDYKFVWFVNDRNKDFPTYIKKVSNNSLNRAFWLSISKIWIDNYRKPYGTCKRKKQYYVNTWHGTIGFKTTGLWRGKAFSDIAYIVSKNDSDMINYVVIDSEWCSEMFPKGLVYNGEFLKTGAPRCDILYGDRTYLKRKFRVKNGLNENVKIMMFAPTFREKNEAGMRKVFSEEWSIDFQMLLKNLQTKFSGEWYICLRVHPQLAELIQINTNNDIKNKIIDVSQEDDMYENLVAMDGLITDYSSVAMDASFGNIPVFIYADDIDEYIKERGSLLWNITRNSNFNIKNNKEMTPGIDTVLPYPIARNNLELAQNINDFDYEEYIENINQFKKDVNLIFDGNASKRVADKIEKYILGK